jgi:prevent-host-death family protein
MTTVNIHEAKAHLSRLIERAANGESFIIAKAGKPMVRVTGIDAPSVPARLGFLAGEIAVPKDFNRMGAKRIATMFGDCAMKPASRRNCCSGRVHAQAVVARRTQAAR